MEWIDINDSPPPADPDRWSAKVLVCSPNGDIHTSLFFNSKSGNTFWLNRNEVAYWQFLPELPEKLQKLTTYIGD